jgi:arginine/lysine/ornithine decarboxylase
MTSRKFSQLTNKLEKFAGSSHLRTHTPVHHGTNLFLPRGFDKCFKRDISEIEGFDNLSKPSGAIKAAEKKAAELFQVEHSFFSVSGASECIMAACLSLGGEGKKVLLPRNAHKSVISGAILAGLTPIWYEPNWNSDWGVYDNLDYEVIEKLIKANKDVAACFITSPTYEGIAMEMGEVVSLCHENEIPVIVDESHGANLSLLEHDLAAIHSCADLVIHSGHKSLGSLTQTAILHFQSEFLSVKKVNAALKLLQTTSPSYLLLTSLIETINQLSQSLKPIQEQHDNSLKLREKIQNFHGINLLPNHDPAKLVFSVDGWSGEQVSQWLQEKYGIESELQNGCFVMLIIGLGVKFHELRQLENALFKLSRTTPEINLQRTPVDEPESFTSSVPPREAFFKEKDPMIEFNCPPGVPTKFPGMVKKAKPKINNVKPFKKVTKPESPFLEEDFGDDEEFLQNLDAELANYA